MHLGRFMRFRQKVVEVTLKVRLFRIKTNFVGCSSRGGQTSDGDFIASAWNFGNNVAELANFQKVIVFPIKMSPMYYESVTEVNAGPISKSV